LADSRHDVLLDRQLLASAIMDAIEAGLCEHDEIVGHAVATLATAVKIEKSARPGAQRRPSEHSRAVEGAAAEHNPLGPRGPGSCFTAVADEP
jgi:hypothetical protein